MSRRTGPGRRPGSPDTRETIRAAARRLFAERGLRGTTIRAVAADAEVDPALVHHYFGTKDALFLAAMEMRVDPRREMAEVVEGGPEGAGERLVRVLLRVWDDPDVRLSLLGVARGLFDTQGQRAIKDGLLGVVVGPVVSGLGVDRPELRVPLVASQMFGIVMLRYVLEVEPVASMPVDQVVAIYGPTLQRYLAGPLP